MATNSSARLARAWLNAYYGLMARVDVELVESMRRPWRERRREIEVEDQTTIDGLLAQLGYSADEARHFTVLVGGARANRSRRLAHGDRVVVLLIVGGG
jgi:sulfur carrier protein ThiS